jgi:hypothetical protein
MDAVCKEEHYNEGTDAGLAYLGRYPLSRQSKCRGFTDAGLASLGKVKDINFRGSLTETVELTKRLKRMGKG